MTILKKGIEKKNKIKNHSLVMASAIRSKVVKSSLYEITYKRGVASLGVCLEALLAHQHLLVRATSKQ